jgi:glycine/D-amino acid oxidase-like deaminating enzyme
VSFASHYDEGRITRTIDPDRDWALLANRSIARYARDRARQRHLVLYAAGCLVVGPARAVTTAMSSGRLRRLRRWASRRRCSTMPALKRRFPFFAFSDGSEGVHEATGAGYISPRNLVRAQSVAAEKAGASVIRDIACRDPRGGRRRLPSRRPAGTTYRAEKVLLAAGGFSIAENLLPQPVDLTVYARTVAFYEVDEAAPRPLPACRR